MNIEQEGIYIPFDTAQKLMQDIREMRSIYADRSREDWWDADDIARHVSEQLGRIIEEPENEPIRQRGLLAEYQAAMVNICRELGCEPNVAVASPDYYEDMALEAVANLQAENSRKAVYIEDARKSLDGIAEALDLGLDTKIAAPYEIEPFAVRDINRMKAVQEKLGDALDHKGRIILQTFEIEGNERPDALVFSPGAVQPYIVAHGYDAETGEWSHGSYYSDLGRAYDAANPEIIEDATVKWELEDVREKLEEYGVDISGRNVAEVLAGDAGTRPVAKYMRENMIASGHEDLNDRIQTLKAQGRFEGQGYAAQKEDKSYSLSSEQRDASSAKEALGTEHARSYNEHEER